MEGSNLNAYLQRGVREVHDAPFRYTLSTPRAADFPIRAGCLPLARSSRLRLPRGEASASDRLTLAHNELNRHAERHFEVTEEARDLRSRPIALLDHAGLYRVVHREL